MKSRTKALLLGGVVGTFLFGPGYGTALGAAIAANAHDRRNGELPPYDDDDLGDRDTP